MEFKHCPDCGAKLTPKDVGDEEPTPFCEACARPFISFSSPAIIAAVVNERREVALLKQSHVSDSHWVLVAGYVTQGETAEQAAAREVEEETGLRVRLLEYISSYHHKRRDLLMLGFIARVEKAGFKPSREVDHIRWFPLREASAHLIPGSIGQRLLEAAAKKIGS